MEKNSIVHRGGQKTIKTNTGSNTNTWQLQRKEIKTETQVLDVTFFKMSHILLLVSEVRHSFLSV